MIRRGKRGFTLMEMLTVIVIIVILAGILLPAVNKAFARAKRAQVRQDLASIKAAVDAYYSEYGRLPLGILQAGRISNSNESTYVYAGLKASTNAVLATGRLYSRAPKNPDAFVFLEGSTLNDEGVFVDPWGSQYLIQFAQDGVVSLRYHSGVSNHHVNVVAMSSGPDRRQSTSDDIYSVHSN